MTDLNNRKRHEMSVAAHCFPAPSVEHRSGDDQASTSGVATGWMQQLLTKVLANMSVSVRLHYIDESGLPRS